MGQRAATLLVLDQYDLDAVARQDVDRSLVDSRGQHLLRTTLQQRDAAAPLALGSKDAAAGRSRLREGPRRVREHRRDAPQQAWYRGGRLRDRQQRHERPGP